MHSLILVCITFSFIILYACLSVRIMRFPSLSYSCPSPKNISGQWFFVLLVNNACFFSIRNVLCSIDKSRIIWQMARMLHLFPFGSEIVTYGSYILYAQRDTIQTVCSLDYINLIQQFIWDIYIHNVLRHCLVQNCVCLPLHSTSSPR